MKSKVTVVFIAFRHFLTGFGLVKKSFTDCYLNMSSAMTLRCRRKGGGDVCYNLVDFIERMRFHCVSIRLHLEGFSTDLFANHTSSYPAKLFKYCCKFIILLCEKLKLLYCINIVTFTLTFMTFFRI